MFRIAVNPARGNYVRMCRNAHSAITGWGGSIDQSLVTHRRVDVLRQVKPCRNVLNIDGARIPANNGSSALVCRRRVVRGVDDGHPAAMAEVIFTPAGHGAAGGAGWLDPLVSGLVSCSAGPVTAPADQAGARNDLRFVEVP